jgi:hypothetical protein
MSLICFSYAIVQWPKQGQIALLSVEPGMRDVEEEG